MPQTSINVSHSVNVAMNMFYRLMSGELAGPWLSSNELGAFQVLPLEIVFINEHSLRQKREVYFYGLNKEWLCQMELTSTPDLKGQMWTVTEMSYREVVQRDVELKEIDTSLLPADVITVPLLFNGLVRFYAVIGSWKDVHKNRLDWLV